MNNNVKTCADEMLEELNSAGVEIKIYSPSFFKYNVTVWNVDLEKTGEGIKVEVVGRGETLLGATLDAYTKWNQIMDKGVRIQLNYQTQIGHKTETEI